MRSPLDPTRAGLRVMTGVLAFGFAASLAACGGSSDQSQAQNPTVSRARVSSLPTSAQSAAPTTSQGATASSATQGGTPSTTITAGATATSTSTVSEGTTSAPPSKSTPAKARVTAAAPGTICYSAYRPNGHPDWNVTVDRNASCGFAKNVGLAVNARRSADMDFDVRAASPSGTVYLMHCHDTGEGITACEGGNDARVIVGRNTGY